MAEAARSTGIVSTAAGTTGAASLYPIITWAVAGFPQPVPEMTAVAIAAYLATGLHVVGVVVCRLVTRYCPDLAAGVRPSNGVTS